MHTLRKVFSLLFICIVSQSYSQTASGDELSQSLQHCRQLLQKYNNDERTSTLRFELLNSGNFLFDNNYYVEAMECYCAAKSLFEEKEDMCNYGMCLLNIGNIFSIFEDEERAVDYYKQVYTIAKTEGYEEVLSIVCVNLAGVLNDLGNAEEAKFYIEEQERHPQADKDEQAYRLYYNKGMLAFNEQDYVKSIELLQQALHHVAGAHNPMGLYNEISKAFFALQQPDSAVFYLHKSAQIASNTNAKYLLADTYRLLFSHYKNTQMRDSILVYQSLYLDLNDSIRNKQLFSTLRNQLQEAEQRLKDQRISHLSQLNRRLVLAVLVCALILLIIGYYSRKMHQAHRLLVLRNEELIKQHRIYTTSAATLQVDAPEPDSVETSTQQVSERAALHLTAEKAQTLIHAILEVFEDVEVISDSEFSLNTLARLVNSNTSYVSAVINDSFQKNFKQLLNEYRIREVCRRLTDTEHYGHLTIIAIAETVGFISKNTFIVTFKKIMGMTPSVYQKLALEQKKDHDS